MAEQKESQPISIGLLFLMATAVSATVANMYYNQPLLPAISETLGMDDGSLGLVPSASQVGYSAAILLISPLGDVMDRKNLIARLSILLSLALFMAGLAPNFWVLVFASFAIGVSCNITQQLIPFAASLSTPETRGKVMGTMMTGLTVGILLSRTASGSIAEYFGWRSVFLVATIIAIAFGLLLHFNLPNSKPSVKMTYPKLIGSMLTLVREHALLRESALTGMLWFAAFNALWATLAIYVTASPFVYSVQQAGMFGLVGLAGIFGAKTAGALVNSVGVTRLITISLLFIISAFFVLGTWSDSLTGLIVGIILLDLGVFGAQIPNQVRVFSIDPSAQSRMNAVYMLFYYTGAAIGSAAGVKIMSLSGWHGLTIFGGLLSAAALLHHLWRQVAKVKVEKSALDNSSPVEKICPHSGHAVTQKERS